MMLRRFAPAPLLALAIFACTPSVPSQQTTTVVTAEFDLASSPPVVPQPNDLAIQPILNPGILSPANAQDELLGYFLAQGGFPADQVLPLEFPLATKTVNGPNDIGSSAPDIDPTTIVPCTGPKTPANCNVFILATQPTVAFPTFAVSYDAGAPGAQSGTLSAVAVSGASPTPWHSDTQAVTHYVYALRGGASGIKTKAGVPLQPSSTTYTLLFTPPGGFTCPPSAPSCPLPLLGLINAGYQPVFALIESYGFPLAETVVVGTFPVAPATTWVLADAATSQLPCPSDSLIDPTTGRITAAADASAGGLPLSSLDGFSTTAMILAPTSGPIQANTVHDPALPQGVFLYEINAAGTGATKVPDLVDALTSAPGRVQPAYVAEPPQIQSGGFSRVIGLQPAVPADPGIVGVPPFMLPPLKENTEYAVIVTQRVKSAAGDPISKTTLGQIELFANPLCTPSPACAASPSTATSKLPGIPGPQASGLEAMRLGLKPVIAQLATDTGCNTTPAGSGCVTRSQVAMAYTFRTQTISGKNATVAGGGRGGAGAIQISAIPYTPLLPGVCAALGTALGVPNLDCTKPLPKSLVTHTGPAAVAEAFTAWGVDTAVPHDKIAAIYELKIATVNKIDDATGAFNPSPTGAKPEVLTVLVAVGDPANPKMPNCTGAAAGLKCAPLVVFQHGITTAKNYVLGVANTLVDAGNIVVGIDLPWHGERTFCSTTAVAGSPNAECVPGNFCVPEPAMAGQAIPPGQAPGKCRTGTSATSPLGAFANEAALCLGNGCSCVPALGACFFPQNQGYPLASGEFFVSANFFRTRDGIRQAWIDQTQLLQVLAPPPVAGQMAGNDFYNALLAKGILVNPADVSFLGQSFGSIISTGSLAANPRISRAVFNTNGGTAVDVFTNAPRYQAEVDALFLSLGIDRTILRSPPAPPAPGDPPSEAYLAYLAQASSYLTYINVLKLIMDPADSINAAGHLETDTWPNLIPLLGGNQDGSVAQSPKKTLAQYAVCDQSVPNPFNALVAGNIGLAPVLPPLTTTPPATGTVQWFASTDIRFPVSPIYPDGCPLGAPHEFLLSWGAESAAGTPGRASVAQLTAAAQTSAAAFLADPVPLSPTLVISPF
jgi:hypothetical protein